MLRDLVWFDGGQAANEDLPCLRSGTPADGLVVHVVQPEDVLEERPHGVPPTPPLEDGPSDDAACERCGGTGEDPEFREACPSCTAEDMS